MKDCLTNCSVKDLNELLASLILDVMKQLVININSMYCYIKTNSSNLTYIINELNNLSAGTSAAINDTILGINKAGILNGSTDTIDLLLYNIFICDINTNLCPCPSSDNLQNWNKLIFYSFNFTNFMTKNSDNTLDPIVFTLDNYTPIQVELILSQVKNSAIAVITMYKSFVSNGKQCKYICT